MPEHPQHGRGQRDRRADGDRGGGGPGRRFRRAGAAKQELALSAAGRSAARPGHEAGGEMQRGTPGSAGSGSARAECDRIVPLRTLETGGEPMHIFRPRATNCIDLPAGTVAAAGLKQGDILHVSAEQDHVILTTRELLNRGRAYKMADLLGPPPGSTSPLATSIVKSPPGRAE